MRLIIADDHDLVRDALSLLIRQDLPEAEIWHASDLPEAMMLAEKHPETDLVLLDLHMPGMNGLEGLEQFIETHPAITVIMMSGMIQPGDVNAAFERGARGFIPKTLSGKALVSVLNAVIAGVRFVPDIMLEQKAAGPLAQFDLSPREMEVLQQLANGYSNKVIARELEIEETTVKLHLRALFRKLDVSNRTEAVVVAARQGLIQEQT